MVRTVKNTTSPGERRAQAEALHASIADQVEALKDTEQWARFLAFAGAFHAYSLNNVLLILAQQPTATRVAGFRKWQELGREVRRPTGLVGRDRLCAAVQATHSDLNACIPVRRCGGRFGSEPTPSLDPSSPASFGSRG